MTGTDAVAAPDVRPHRPFLTRVRDCLPTCHPMERRLAESVIDFPGELASYTASELARHAGVSNATVTRLIKRMGYRNYEEARLHVREERRAGSPLYLASRSAGTSDPLQAQLEQSLGNLRRTLAPLADAELNRIARAVLAARKVWVVGFRSSHSFATYLRWQAFQVKEDIFVIPAAGDTLGQYVASMTRRDVVIVFGLRRRPASLRDAVTRIVDSGAKVLYITDAEVARQPAVTWHVQCSCGAIGALDDHVGVIAICHLLATRLVELAGPAERQRLKAIESSYQELREL
jgi:DNA-binding MurR/RpiR family transcriptional regulator